MPFESPALREGETICGHPGSDRCYHGDPAGLRVHGDGARDCGECAGAAPCSLSASAERYRCCSCISHAKVACTLPHERPPYSRGRGDRRHSGVHPGREGRISVTVERDLSRCACWALQNRTFTPVLWFKKQRRK